MAKKSALKAQTSSQAALVPAESAAPIALPLDPDPQAAFLLHTDYALVEGKAPSRIGQRRHLHIAVAAVVLCLLLLWLALRQAEENALLDAQSGRAPAEIIARRFEDNPRALQRRWFITYQFSLPDGRTFSREISVEAAEYDFYFVGSRVVVKFSPEQPELNTLANRRLERVESDLLMLMAIVPPLLSLPILLWALAQNILLTQYERRGVVVRGEVIECTGEERASHYYIKLRYQFILPDMKIRRGTAHFVRDDLRGAKLPEKGTQVAVLYLNDWFYRLL
ncbi:MAG: hypothetical protein CUN49_04300 [Candidatus Thermofonsia Clade 1 bacterium]|jgi:hypothetical protein|uniref:DUF3592 domain-containing protein n=1 Tax=Candidatus Thermofonsia Clade 1 bacterium TaxID=2364210 RepID=A0A2M8Q0M5_9CHLR|nr:MAG: hypothetical protein CUN49_04300 [Candidatus Thermofonsia Clade 1 bacterium]PJF43353.1 MAG: hypothetical protein CUN50_00040 [Candidatus Thermofonsia Clade 1 bacterium]RMF50188.1 MAG: hypothetical protein D6749_11185 [Chloroflexota bacterium]